MAEYISVGYIFGIKGLKGEVKIKSLTSLNRFFPGSVLRVDPIVGGYEKLTVEKANNKTKNLIIKFEEINSIDEAQLIKNHYLEAEKTSLPENTYYSDELIGLEVVTAEGKKLGIVDDVLTTKAHDILSVKGKKEVDIPVTRMYVKKIDLDKNKIIVKDVEWLLEL